ncbi:DUF3558 domain-containing protein [Streptomyces sp. NPDC058045]|uniref:DUF3558 domain-containing protein n=1 Tax=Streptomyces sp. NPDC058045 TaxID=3346311 RepID=UPI0036E39D55
MQRKAYLPGVAALLAAVLAGCSGGTDGGSPAEDAKSNAAGSATASAAPGKYRTLPEPCGTVDHRTLDTLLPGIKDIADERERERAYDGSAAATFDTDRRVGCSWKLEGQDATHRLRLDFERVVSYDRSVSDADRAGQVFADKETDAGLGSTDANSPNTTETDTGGASTGKPSKGDRADRGDRGDGADKPGTSNKPGAGEQAADASPDPSDSPSGSPSAEATATEGPRTLGGLGDAAFLDDAYSSSSATGARHRTVTVVFRTSNVIVTLTYDEQPARSTDVPDSKEMQDNAQSLAHRLAGKLTG